MKRSQLPFWAVLMLAFAFLLSGALACGDDDDDDDDDDNVVFDPTDFQTTVDNTYWPLVPGTVKTLEGEEEGEELLVITTVMDETETIAGVECTVLKEEEYEDGELVEVSMNWFAQEIATGDVYYFGEDVDEYEDGEIVGNPGAWRVGENADAPGLIFPGNPQVGDTFSPESAPDEAEETAEIVEMGLDYSTPFAEYTDVIKVEEHDLLEDEVEWKYYAPDVGLIAEESEEGGIELTDLE